MEAIEYSWELLLKAYGFDPDRLYVTYFERCIASRLGPDKEAKKLWHGVDVMCSHRPFLSCLVKWRVHCTKGLKLLPSAITTDTSGGLAICPQAKLCSKRRLHD